MERSNDPNAKRANDPKKPDRKNDDGRFKDTIFFNGVK